MLHANSTVGLIKKKGEEFTVELVSLRRWRRDRSGEGVEAVRESDEEEEEGRGRQHLWFWRNNRSLFFHHNFWSSLLFFLSNLIFFVINGFCFFF